MVATIYVKTHKDNTKQDLSKEKKKNHIIIPFSLRQQPLIPVLNTYMYLAGWGCLLTHGLNAWTDARLEDLVFNSRPRQHCCFNVLLQRFGIIQLIQLSIYNFIYRVIRNFCGGRKG